MMKCEWILCPVCGSKTRNKIRKDTVLENYPLYCPKCRQERLIKVDNLKTDREIGDAFRHLEYFLIVHSNILSGRHPIPKGGYTT
ncbi:cysteine-rich KTR domain-containing protein [Dorea sp.]